MAGLYLRDTKGEGQLGGGRLLWIHAVDHHSEGNPAFGSLLQVNPKPKSIRRGGGGGRVKGAEDQNKMKVFATKSLVTTVGLEF